MAGMTAATAFGALIKGMLPLVRELAGDSHAVHVLVRTNALAAPSEIVALAQEALPEVREELALGSGLCEAVHCLCACAGQAGGLQALQPMLERGLGWVANPCRRCCYPLPPRSSWAL